MLGSPPMESATTQHGVYQTEAALLGKMKASSGRDFQHGSVACIKYHEREVRDHGVIGEAEEAQPRHAGGDGLGRATVGARDVGRIGEDRDGDIEDTEVSDPVAA
ncbi:hypothetical protein BC938DRAFT_475600 [Jimgerdemannia flammicorona]|uniref:Uncharacterized protein n=1 Tax=Jimgerdemannia flammicorona TaxID=994334 RepID=A0A433QRG1_9FUNG|nr:hypothetical protein BC938DRAFT_475600 [Jimgerdemannia flammicorona]